MGLDTSINVVYYSTNRKGERHPNIEKIGYLSKAYLIHNWFVHNIQDGVNDTYVPYYITLDQLKRLKEDCLKVIQDKTRSNLKEVFPFATETDTYFNSLSSLKLACEIVDSCFERLESLKQYDYEDIKFYFYSG